MNKHVSRDSLNEYCILMFLKLVTNLSSPHTFMYVCNVVEMI